MPASAASAVASPTKPDDTRTRILKAALKLFRKHGFHGVGMTEILSLADTPKGSAYHHFPGGKQAIAVAVVEGLSESILAMMPAPGTLSATKAVQQVGGSLVSTVERTNHEICSMFSAFAAARDAAPELTQAVGAAYQAMCAKLELILLADGFTKAQARDKAQLVVMLFEGAGMLSAATHDVTPFKLAVRQAQAICNPSL